MPKVIEILLYTLHPGKGASFHQIMQDISVPLHRRMGMDVVCYGQSLDEPDSYYLVRAYDHLDHLTRSQRDFYQSDAWKAGPRTEIIACIATSLKSVISMTDEAIDAIR